jgi:hypothetical protein
VLTVFTMQTGSTVNHEPPTRNRELTTVNCEPREG